MDDLDCCRTCSHFQFLHFKPWNYPGGCTSIPFDEPFCDPGTDHGCDCKEYVPTENLEYLEYLYEKKKTAIQE